MNYILPVTLDLYKTNPTINAKQNDAGSRYILATITANGVAQSVPETATVTLGMATAKAVGRIPDANCNGDMHKALEEAEQAQKESNDFLNRKVSVYING